MDHVRWGPVHDCSKCGALVVYQIDDRRRFPRLFDAGSASRHNCPKAVIPPAIEFHECVCGINIEIVGGTRYAQGSNALHVCAHSSKPSTAAKPDPRPPVAVVPSLDRIPRGAIIL